MSTAPSALRSGAPASSIAARTERVSLTHALGMVAQVQVYGAHAQSIATARQHVHTFRNRADRLFVDPAMRLTLDAQLGEPTVAVAADRTLPCTAFASAINMLPPTARNQPHPGEATATPR